jgi:hypothetical protein
VRATRAAICVDGPIEAGVQDDVVAALRGRPEGAVLVVRSRGGDVGAGLAIARAVLANRATVAVRDFCVSSCANYIFAPARRRYVLADSIVGFHGGASDRLIAQALNQIEAEPSLAAAERADAKRDMSQMLGPLVQGQTRLLHAMHRPAWFFDQFDYGAPHFLRRPLDCSGAPGWAMLLASPETLAAVGLSTRYEGVRSLAAATRVLGRQKLDRPVCYMR